MFEPVYFMINCLSAQQDSGQRHLRKSKGDIKWNQFIFYRLISSPSAQQWNNRKGYHI